MSVKAFGQFAELNKPKTMRKRHQLIVEYHTGLGDYLDEKDYTWSHHNIENVGTFITIWTEKPIPPIEAFELAIEFAEHRIKHYGYTHETYKR